MKRYPKLILGIAGLAAAARLLLVADAAETYSTTTKPYAAGNVRSNSLAVSSSSGVMAALNGQALLLKDLLQEHQRLAADLAQKGQNERAKWETELVDQLQERSAHLQKRIEQQASSGSAPNESRIDAGDTDDELVFISTVETRLEQIRQEISGAIEDIRALSMLVSTNKTPEDISAMSFTLTDNQRLVKELEREKLDLELRKLQFRAILKATQR